MTVYIAEPQKNNSRETLLIENNEGLSDLKNGALKD